MGVWDIEVEGDHSYLAQGLVHHNSSRDPNLQNVPAARDDLGRMIRSLFEAEPGRLLVVADYGQVELVLLAHFAYVATGKKGALWRGFHDGIDPHTMTAAMVLGKDPKDVTSNERQRFGKSLNFAVTYGAGPSKVASMADVSTEEAKELLAKYDRKFPEVGQLRKHILDEARHHSLKRTGYPPHSKTLLGRMRRVPSVNSMDQGLKMYSERQLFNAELQGSNADLTKMAMNTFMRDRQPDWDMLLVVHDEIVVSTPEDQADNCKLVLVNSMAGPEMQSLLTVPLTVDAKIVRSWDKAK